MLAFGIQTSQVTISIMLFHVRQKIVATERNLIHIFRKCVLKVQIENCTYYPYYMYLFSSLGIIEIKNLDVIVYLNDIID